MSTQAQAQDLQAQYHAGALSADEYKELLEDLKHQSKAVFSGMDKYFDDLDKYENDFNCNECGFEGVSEFAFERKVSNGEVWHCKNCKAEKVVGHKPNEDNY